MEEISLGFGGRREDERSLELVGRIQDSGFDDAVRGLIDRASNPGTQVSGTVGLSFDSIS